MSGKITSSREAFLASTAGKSLWRRLILGSHGTEVVVCHRLGIMSRNIALRIELLVVVMMS
jgi:hypothetical protein